MEILSLSMTKTQITSCLKMVIMDMKLKKHIVEAHRIVAFGFIIKEEYMPIFNIKDLDEYDHTEALAFTIEKHEMRIKRIIRAGFRYFNIRSKPIAKQLNVAESDISKVLSDNKKRLKEINTNHRVNLLMKMFIFIYTVDEHREFLAPLIKNALELHILIRGAMYILREEGYIKYVPKGAKVDLI